MHGVVNPVLFRTLPTVPRSLSLQSFGDYRESESANGSNTKTAVAPDGTLLEYETLELRIHPPNVEVDNETWKDRTVITVDSANRPGTLVEVIQCLTELGLDIKQARISSDGGWFVDEFHVCEHGGGRVEDVSKINAIRKVLNVGIEKDAEEREPQDSTSVFEIAARDDPGVLGEVVDLLQHNGCDIKSLAAWTYYSRAALVVSICDRGRSQAVANQEKLKRLKELLYRKVQSEFGEPYIKLTEKVVGAVHSERRLHQLLLMEEKKAWARYQNSHRSSPEKEDISSSRDEEPPPPGPVPLMPPQTPTIRPRGTHARTVSMPVLTAAGLQQPPPPINLPDCSPPSPRIHLGETSPIAVPTQSLLREDSTTSSNGSLAHPSSRPPRQEPSAPVIEIRRTPLPYWLVTIKCRDRTKLSFDTVCTLADMRYDVYHAAIDTEDQIATQLFYVKSRKGDVGWDEEARERLRYMLRAAVERRFPGGLKVHMLAEDMTCVAQLAQAFSGKKINIARVKVFESVNGTDVSMYLMGPRGGVPDLQVVQDTCEQLGGQYLVVREDSPAASWDRSMLQGEESSPDADGPFPGPPAGMMMPRSHHAAAGAVAAPMPAPADPSAGWIHIGEAAYSASPSATRPTAIDVAKQQLQAARRDGSKRFSFTFSYIDRKWEGF